MQKQNKKELADKQINKQLNKLFRECDAVAAKSCKPVPLKTRQG